MKAASAQTRNAAMLAVPNVLASEDEPHNGYLYLHAFRHLRRRDPQMAEAMDRIYYNSDLGRRMLLAAKSSKTAFLRRQFADASTKGEHWNNTISLSVYNGRVDDVRVIPHELMHSIQPKIVTNVRWDYPSRLLAVMSMEAGAESCAARVLHEMFINGCRRPFRRVAQKPDGYGEVFTSYANGLRYALDQNWHDPVRAGSDAAFHHYFHQPSLVKWYGTTMLQNYMQEIFQSAPSFPQTMFGHDDAAKQARLADGESLVLEPLNLPSTSGQLRDNNLLRQAFEFAEMEHITKAAGYDLHHTAVRRKWRTLEEEGNRFRDLDLDRVMIMYEMRQKSRNAPDILDFMLDLA